MCWMTKSERMAVCAAILMVFVFLYSAKAYAGAESGAFSSRNVSVKTNDSEKTEKRAQILRLFEVQPPSQAVDAAIQSIANIRFSATDPARDEFVSRMQLSVDYDKIESASITSMMDLYTLPELTAMADYYTSDLGRSAEGKGPAFRAKIAPILKEMLDKGVLSVITSPSPADSVSNLGR